MDQVAASYVPAPVRYQLQTVSIVPTFGSMGTIPVPANEDWIIDSMIVRGVTPLSTDQLGFGLRIADSTVQSAPHIAEEHETPVYSPGTDATVILGLYPGASAYDQMVAYQAVSVRSVRSRIPGGWYIYTFVIGSIFPTYDVSVRYYAVPK